VFVLMMLLFCSYWCCVSFVIIIIYGRFTVADIIYTVVTFIIFELIVFVMFFFCFVSSNDLQ